MSNVDPETGIWSLHIAKKRHKCDTALAGMIGILFSPNRVADLGCGDGRYCSIFKAYGWPEIHGYEGTKDVQTLNIYDDIMYIDLTKKRVVDIEYDLVVCLEVGEHIPPQHEQTFLDNLLEFTSKDLILSWALPGQYSASGHVNCQPNDYIITQLSQRNLYFDETTTHLLRQHSYFKWFKKGVMVFRR
jgi:hypothetical protein